MHTVSVSILSSGSCGNSTVITSDEGSIMIDAGISCRELERRLSYFGVEPTQVEAVVLTHEHTDHVRGAERFCKVHGVPAIATKGTLSLTPLGGVETRSIAAGREFSVGGFIVRPFKVRHLAAEPVALSVQAAGGRIGFASDLGSVTPGIVNEMRESNLMIVESNYDEKMLMEGDYPEFLKRSIRGNHGHLSNEDAGLLASKAASEETDRVVLVHLSHENNTPEKARETVQERLSRSKVKAKLEVAEHGSSAGPFRLR